MKEHQITMKAELEITSNIDMNTRDLITGTHPSTTYMYTRDLITGTYPLTTYMYTRDLITGTYPSTTYPA